MPMLTDVYYVYLHRRKTDSKIFYVGKGKANRCFSHKNRNKRWIKTVSDHGFDVEIVWEDLSESEALALEVDTIKEMRYFYPETMCNVLDGGNNGPSWLLKGKKQPREWTKKSSESRKGLKRLPELVKKIREAVRRSKSGSIAFTHMCKILIGKRPVKLRFLEKIQNLPPRSLYAEREHSGFPSSAVEISANNRRGKKPHNYGAKYPHLTGISNSSADKNHYLFKRSDGEIFYGTRYDLCEKYRLNLEIIGKLFYKKPNKTSQGWSLNEKT